MQRVGLIDGDIAIYRAAFQSEQTHEWEPGQWTSTANEEEGRVRLSDFVSYIADKLKLDRVVLAMSDSTGNYFRKKLLPTYKAPRGKVRKPLLMKPLREWAKTQWKVYEKPGLEADDVLGILATSNVIEGRKVIVSVDKDMKQIPGWLFNPDKHDKPVKVSDDEAELAFWTQVLCGDVTDNYPGCPGVGPVKAARILAGKSGFEAWTAVCDAFDRHDPLTEPGDSTRAIIMARVARILRAEDYDFKKKEVRLWTPPNT